MTPANRLRQRILKHALAFLSADVRISDERDQWRELRAKHKGDEDPPCDPKYPEDQCDECKAFLEKTPYKKLLQERSSRKRSMRTAYALLAEAELGGTADEPGIGIGWGN